MFCPPGLGILAPRAESSQRWCNGYSQHNPCRTAGNRKQLVTATLGMLSLSVGTMLSLSAAKLRSFQFTTNYQQTGASTLQKFLSIGFCNRNDNIRVQISATQAMLKPYLSWPSYSVDIYAYFAFWLVLFPRIGYGQTINGAVPTTPLHPITAGSTPHFEKDKSIVGVRTCILLMEPIPNVLKSLTIGCPSQI